MQSRHSPVLTAPSGRRYPHCTVQPPFSATVPSLCRPATIIGPSLAALLLSDAHRSALRAALSRHAAFRDHRRAIPVAPRLLAVRFPHHPHLVRFFPW
ncbi:acetyl-CoA acetyltransferase [Sesbania bispinosa]|nr:acetyl-CoA acetyltransferase [Sesbania bispinosa]